MRTSARQQKLCDHLGVLCRWFAYNVTFLNIFEQAGARRGKYRSAKWRLRESCKCFAESGANKLEFLENNYPKYYILSEVRRKYRNGNKNYARRPKSEIMDPQGEQKWAKGRQKWANWSQKVVQREPKGSQRAPKLSPRATKGNQKRAVREPKGDQNASQNRYLKKGAEKERKRNSRLLRIWYFWTIFHQKRIQKSMHKSMSKKTWHFMKNHKNIIQKSI